MPSPSTRSDSLRGRTPRRPTRFPPTPWPSPRLTRPLRLLRDPQPIEVTAIAAHGPPVHMVWRGEDRRVVRAWGPERIATGWWRSRDVQRDYYRAEWEQGTQVWVYRETPGGRWFLHGFFD